MNTTSKWRLYTANSYQDYASHRDLWKHRDEGHAFAGPEFRAQHPRPLFVYMKGEKIDGQWDCWISYVTETRKDGSK